MLDFYQRILGVWSNPAVGRLAVFYHIKGKEMSAQVVGDENQPPEAPVMSSLSSQKEVMMLKSPMKGEKENADGEGGLENFLVAKKAVMNSATKTKGLSAPGAAMTANNKKGEVLNFDFGAPAASGSAPASLQENFKRFRKQKVKERRIMMQNKEELATKGPRSQEFKDVLREKFINQAKKYIGVPYAERYKKPEDPVAPLYLDCCGLVLVVAC